MNRDKIDWCIYWAGIGFIVGCLSVAMAPGGCSTARAESGHTTEDCLDYPPVCAFGFKPLCWCTEDGCKWHCTSDGGFG